MLSSHPMQWRRALLLAVVCAEVLSGLSGCRRSDGGGSGGADTDDGPDKIPAVEDRSPEEKTFGQNPLTLQSDPAASPTTAPSQTPTTLTLTPPNSPATDLHLPPARLTLAPDGSATLDADSEHADHTLHLTFTPSSDSPRSSSPWRHATYRFQLTSLDDQTTDGLYTHTDPDAQLRPAELSIDLTRLPNGQVRILISGALIPAQADTPSTAPRYFISGDFTATIQQGK